MKYSIFNSVWSLYSSYHDYVDLQISILWEPRTRGLQGVSSKQDENKYCLSLTKRFLITLAHTRITLGKKKNRWIRTRLTFLFCTPWFIHFHIILFFSMYPKNNWSISGFVHTSAQIHVFVSSFNDLNLTT